MTTPLKDRRGPAAKKRGESSAQELSTPSVQSRVLLIEDDPNFLKLLSINLGRRYCVVKSDSAEQALKLLERDTNFDVIIADYNLPGLDGIQFLEKAREIVPVAMRMMLTGEADIKNAVEAVNRGSLFRFLLKSGTFDELHKAVEEALAQAALLRSERELLEKTLSGSIKLLVELLSLSRPTIFQRSRRVCHRARCIATRLLFDNIWELDVATLLSSIGCMSLPEDLVSRWLAGEKLPDIEHQMIASYPSIGESLLEKIPRLEDVAKAIGMQNRTFEPVKIKRPLEKFERHELLTATIQIAADFESFQREYSSELAAFHALSRSSHKYHPRLMSALHAEILQAESGYVVAEIPLAKLRAGMVLAENLLNTNDNIIMPRKHEVSEAELIRLSHIAVNQTIREPIRVLQQIAGSMAKATDTADQKSNSDSGN